MSNFLEKLGNLDEHIQASLAHWNVPGVAVSIVKDGEAVLARGYGYKDYENKKEMTPDTVLPIGSASKSFTSMAAAILVDEGKMDWDKPINEYIPGFKMFDGVASNYISVRDMLCHRGGMPRHDLMWAGGTGEAFTREELIRRVRFLENNTQFREKAQYQNHMFATVGHAIEKVAGKTWEEFVKEKILNPIGMTDSNFHVDESQKRPDYALPYRHDKERNITAAKFMSLSAAGPAGSINSTVNDMTKWIKLVLGKGTLGETKVVSEDRVKEMHTPHMHYQIMPWEFEELLFPSLGLGWFTDVFRGKKIVHHGGNVTGFTALCALLPSENLGVCILVNMNGSFMTYALRNEIFDRALGHSGGDWNVRYKNEFEKLFAQAEEGKQKIKDSRVPDTKPTLDINAYAGEYEHDGYGKIILTKNDEPLGFDADFNGRVLKLKHYHYDQFNLYLETFDVELPSRFALSGKGEIESLAVPFEAALGKEIVFKKKVEEKEEK